MGFIKTLIGIPLLIVILVFAFVNNDLATFSLWPFYVEITVSLSVAIVFLLLVGFILGNFFCWLSYAPIRKALRVQKKQNRKLSKEQQKLAKEMEDLHENLANLKELEAQMPKVSIWERFKNWFRSSDKKEEESENK